MGGTKIYIELLRLITSHERYRELGPLFRGCVFDSTPSGLTIIAGARARSAHLTGISQKLTFVLVWLFMVLRLLPVWFCKTPDPITRMGLNELLSTPLQSRVPLVYVYGPGDVVCPSPFIKHWIDKQFALGYRVRGVVFEGSPHVSHLRVHPLKYTTVVSDFLTEAFASSSPASSDAGAEKTDHQE